MNYIKYGESVFHGDYQNLGANGLIMRGSAEQFVALFGNELGADSLRFVVNSEALYVGGGGYDRGYLFDVDLEYYTTINGEHYAIGPLDWRNFRAGTPLDLYNRQGGEVIGRFYVKNVRQISRKSVEFTCTDCVGVLLDMADHGGGIYAGEQAGAIIDEIIGRSGIQYTVASDVYATRLYGRLPRDNPRDNLARILTATGATLIERGALVSIEFVEDMQETAMPQRTIYLDTGSVDYKNPATEVQVTEHAFYKSDLDERTTLYDNMLDTDEAVEQLVIFSEPCYDITASEGLAINESNPNYAIVTGKGTLDGTIYTHVRQVLQKRTGVSSSERVVSLSNNELVGFHNSEYVARRMVGYYKLKNSVRCDAYDATGLMRPGEKFRMVDPFGKERVGWLEKKTFPLGHKTRANMTFAIDWIPGPSGNNFKNVVVMTASGSWSIPEGTDFVRLVIGQGGEAGQNGFNGAPGYTPEWSHDPSPCGGAGGDGGRGGNGGKVTVVDLNNPTGQIAVTIGSGGTPNYGSGAIGNEGGETEATVNGTTFSSADGDIPTGGYYDVIGGEIFSRAADGGLRGSDGGTKGRGEDFEYNGQVWVGGNIGLKYQTTGEKERIAYGGRGGGAAYGANGGNGGDYYWHSGGSAITGGYYIGGEGGRGANARQRPFTPRPGGGGIGGNGGGGGGIGGYYYYEEPYPATPDYDAEGYGRNGAGGSASLGGNGGDGYVLIYY